MKKQCLTLAVNFAGLEAEQVKAFLLNLDTAVQVFSLSSGATLRLVYACFVNDDRLRREIAERFSGRVEIYEITTAVKTNLSVVINRLLKYCFVNLDATVCMVLQSGGLIHRNSLVQAYEQYRRTSHVLIGSRLLSTISRPEPGSASVGSFNPVDSVTGIAISEYNFLVPEVLYRRLGGLDCTLDFAHGLSVYSNKAEKAGFRFIKLDPRAGLGSISSNSKLLQAPSPGPAGLKAFADGKSSYQNMVREFYLVRAELDDIKHSLRSLKVGFCGVSSLVARLPVRQLKRFFAGLYRIPLVRNSLALFGTLFAWLYFRVRLPGIFNYIAGEHPEINSSQAFDEFEAEQKLIVESGLFDTYYYLSQAPEAADYPLGPVGHYLDCGWHLSPHRLFDPEYYRTANELPPEADAMAPLLHYLQTTGVEAFSPHPLFDAVYYVHSRKDLSESEATFNPLQHYVQRSAVERQDPHPLFFTSYYIARYSHEIGPKQTPLEHFIMRGYTGIYSPNPLFDCAYYLRQQPALKHTLTNPLVHYIQSGRWDRARTHPLFDIDYYLRQLPEGEVADGDPLTHFLHSDVAKLLSPTPLFDPHFYAERTPYVHQAGLNAFSHYLSDGEPIGLDPCPMFHTRWFRARHRQQFSSFYDSALAYYAEEAEARGEAPHPFFDPELYRKEHPEVAGGSALAHYNLHQGNVPLVNNLAKVPSCQTIASLDQSFQRLLDVTAKPFTHLVLMPGLVHGGAERAACNYIRYLQNRHGKENILILFSIYEEHTAIDWLPEGSRVVDLLKLGSETFEDHGLLQAAFIVEKAPPVVHCLNAYNFKMAMARYRKILEPVSRYLIYLFGYEAYTKAPNELSNSLMQGSAGWADFVVTDSEKLVQLILSHMPERRSVEKPRLTVCVYNAAPGLTDYCDYSLKKHADSTRTKVLWASRFVESKRPDLLIKIARRLPDIKFMVYGSPETADMGVIQGVLKELEETPNISYFGEYSSFNAIDKSDIGIICYTSDSDGIPMVLLEAAASGLPVVAPNVGGIPELVTADTGWLINRFDDVEGYAKAILEAISNRVLAETKVNNARRLVFERHSTESFAKKLAQFADYF